MKETELIAMVEFLQHTQSASVAVPDQESKDYLINAGVSESQIMILNGAPSILLKIN